MQDMDSEDNLKSKKGQKVSSPLYIAQIYFALVLV